MIFFELLLALLEYLSKTCKYTWFMNVLPQISLDNYIDIPL